MDQNDQRDREMLATLQVLCTYLLFERSIETQVRTAFAILVQERHNEFHTNGERKNGDGTAFADCSNEICVGARNILEAERKTYIELNPIGTEIIKDYVLKLTKGPSVIKAWIEEKSPIVPASEGPLIMKV